SVLSISTTLGFGLLWGVWGSLLAPILSDLFGLAVMHYMLKNLGLTPLTSSYTQILPSLKKMTLNFQFTS
ncbi:hypothetical protein, partial [Nodularia spumigena]|uniref:hypothetical protein n=1 Tax=Nodularia spumigena TaxID=70799 RepID=UPI002B207D80